MPNESNSQRKNWAVLVGVDDYKQAPLPGSVNNMMAIEASLLEIGFSKENIFSLVSGVNENRLPTYDNILRDIRRVCQSADTGDFISVFLSGHGCQIAETSFFQPTDVGNANQQLLRIDRIYKELGASKAQFKLLVIEACRSSPFGEHVSMSRSCALVADLGHLPTPPPGIAVLSSCAAGEVSWQMGDPINGIFFRFFLEGLTGKADANKDRVITFLELCTYVINKTKTFTKRVAEHRPSLKLSVQTPYIKGDFTDFVFTRKYSKRRSWKEFWSSLNLQFITMNPHNLSTLNSNNETMTDKWNLSENEFAKRLGPEDVTDNTFSVPLGTRALVMADGNYLGEVPAGKYTPQTPPAPSQNEGLSLIRKVWGFFFGQQSKAEKEIEVHAVLVRQEDVPMERNIPNLLTADDRLVEIAVRVVVQIKDIASFAKNLFGSRRLYSIGEIEKTCLLIISQGLRETIKHLNSESLESPDARDILITGIKEAIHNSLLGRYGIDLADIHVAEIYNKEKESLRGIQRDERENDLAVLAAHVELDREEADIALTLRRCQLRKDMEKVTQSDDFDKIKSSEDFETFIWQIDKQNLLREDEKHELKTLFDSKKHDREAARDFIARKLELDRNTELDRLQAEIEHAQKAKTIQYEMELARLTDDESSRLWIQTLENEAKRMELAYRNQSQKMQKEHELNAKNMTFIRSEEWENLLQRQKTTRLQGEIDEETAARKIRLQRIEAEYAEEAAAREVRTKRITDTYDDEQKRREHALDKEVKIDEYDLEKKKKDDEDARQRETMREQSAQLREMRKQRYEHDESKMKHRLDVLNVEAQRDIELSKNESQAQIALREEAAQRERELQKQLLENAQAANTATLETIKEITGQAFGAMGQGTGRPGLTQGNAPATVRVIICNSCRTENQHTAKFCAGCGKEL